MQHYFLCKKYSPCFWKWASFLQSPTFKTLARYIFYHKLQLRSFICSAKGLLLQGCNGRKIRFWTDKWLQVGILRDIFPRFYSLSIVPTSCLAEMGEYMMGIWQWQLYWKRRLWSSELTQYQQRFQLLGEVRLSPIKEDRRYRKAERHGMYIVKSCPINWTELHILKLSLLPLYCGKE